MACSEVKELSVFNLLHINIVNFDSHYKVRFHFVICIVFNWLFPLFAFFKNIR